LHKVRRVIISLLVNVPVILLSLTCIFPVIWLVYSSLKTNKEFAISSISLPSSLNFDNYVKAFRQAHFGTFIFNSVFNSAISLVCVLFMSFALGYLIARYRFKGRNLIYILLMAGVMIPVHALMVPLFIQDRNLDMLNQRFTLIFPYVALQLPVGVFLTESYIKGISTDLEDSATIDGAGMFRTMFSIIFPICKPILSTVLILTFMSVWNEFPFSQILISSDKYKTIPVGLTYFTSQYNIDYTLLLSALVMATLPVLIIYLLFYNKVMEGMMTGAIKG
jgi:raffinose/stachyose/melibiose transport system permease protein